MNGSVAKQEKETVHETKYPMYLRAPTTRGERYLGTLACEQRNKDPPTQGMKTKKHATRQRRPQVRRHVTDYPLVRTPIFTPSPIFGASHVHWLATPAWLETNRCCPVTTNVSAGQQTIDQPHKQPHEKGISSSFAGKDVERHTYCSKPRWERRKKH